MSAAPNLDPGPAQKARQRAAILAALKAAPLSTLDARSRLGVQHVAGRVHELRRQGHRIVTRSCKCFDAEGRPHTVALYVLQAEGAA